jgi:16S rRNA (cytidine1402-2'-O)-methyltransferase
MQNSKLVERLQNGALYLLPNLLDEELNHELFFPTGVNETVHALDGLIAESEKGARRYLRRFLSHERMAAMPLKLLNEHTKPSELPSMLDPLEQGQSWGVVSDAGLPCIADPGADLVLLAHQRHINIVSFPGPCAPVMALQLSGLNGQRFAFHGYLPRETALLMQRLKQLESRSHQENATQIWIEAPYRSAKMAETVICALDSKTLFCIAFNLTCPNQFVSTRTIAEWKRSPVSIEKQPAVFLLFD